jgi:2-methylcitrate dehydratase PrpD
MALCFRRHPKDEFEGQVSLYQWVAAALLRGRAGIPEGTDQAIADPAITALRDRIEVVTDAAVPHDGGDMTVKLADGRTVARSIRNCIGSRGRPMTDDELDAKFLSAAETVLGANKSASLLKALRNIDQVTDAASLARAGHCV